MASRNIVSPQDFARQMTAHWETNLNNTSSTALEQLWTVMGKTFNQAILGHEVCDTTWRVLEPATGTGKTQGMVIYAAMMAELNTRADLEHRTGILIVVRTISQANENVADINRIVGKEVAIAWHSENKTVAIDCLDKDVLVVTHSAFQNAAEAAYCDRLGKLSAFTQWVAGERQLTIIDEALGNIVEQYKVELPDLHMLLACVDRDMRREYPTAVEALEQLRDMLTELEGAPSGRPDKFVWRERTSALAEMTAEQSLQGLLKDLSARPLDQIISGRYSQPEKQRLVNVFSKSINSCANLLSKWAYFNRSGKGSLNSAELLIPSDLRGPVVLDATASANMIWELLGDKAVRPSVPRNARNYRNVTLHFAYAKGVGKTTTLKKGCARATRILTDLEDKVRGRRVLLFTHQAVEAKVQALEPDFGQYETAHWANIDGRNDWKDFDVAVVMSLPFRGSIWATNTFFAHQGAPEANWFASPSWRQYKDIRATLQTQQVIVDVVQAINRICCRRVIDGDGNCPRADIFIVLPNDGRGKDILTGIEAEMPGIRMTSWDMDVDGDALPMRRTEGYQPLVTLMSQVSPGEYPLRYLEDALGWGKSKLKELGQVLQDTEHWLPDALGKLGVEFSHNGQKGRAARSYLIKD